MRLSLSSFDVIPDDDPTVQRFVSQVSLREDGGLVFVPQSRDKEWITRMVRHKKRRAYLYGKNNYIVALSHVKSYDVKSDDLTPNPYAPKEVELVLIGNDWREHYEIEVSFVRTLNFHSLATSVIP